MALDRKPGWMARLSASMKEETIAKEPSVKPKLDQAEYHRQLEEAKAAAIADALPALLDRRQEFFDAAIEQHVADVAAYDFECRRHGDFLTVFATRLDHRGSTAKFSTAINLLKVTEIRLTSGVAPAVEQDVYWSFQYESQNGGVYSSSPLRLPRDGETLKAYSWLPPASTGRDTYREPTKPDDPSGVVVHWGHYECESKSGAMPSPAQDDEVVFVGIGSALLVPFGKGQMVLDAILEKMAANPTKAALLP